MRPAARRGKTAHPERKSDSLSQSAACLPPGRTREIWLLSIAKIRQHYARARTSTRGLLGELCSLLHRMQILRKHKLAHRGLDLGPIYEKDADERLVMCRHTRACTEDIEHLQEQFPWLSLTDLQLCLIAWEVGFESCARQATGSGNQSHSVRALA